jgi:hypothetical protein
MGKLAGEKDLSVLACRTDFFPGAPLMLRWFPPAVALALSLPPSAVRADAFDYYINPVLAKVPQADGVKLVKRLTPALLAEHSGVLPQTGDACFLVVKTNGGRFCKLLVRSARHKTAQKTLIPVLLIERYVTYRLSGDRAVEAQGQNVLLFDGFQFSLDLGQVVPAKVGGDLRFVADKGKGSVEPVGEAKTYLLTKPLPGVEPKKGASPVIGGAFEARYFNGTYKLHADGRRSGTLKLEVGAKNQVSGTFYSDKTGRKYQVKGKVAGPAHRIEFTILFPQSKEVFRGWMFTGDGKAIAGSSRLQDRDTGFYALRVEGKE